MLSIVLCTVAMPFIIFCSYLMLLYLANRFNIRSRNHLSKINFSADTSLMSSQLTFSIMVVTRNLGPSLLKKLHSISELESQEQISDVVIGLDGANTSDLSESERSKLDELEKSLPIKYVESSDHIGKNAVINKIISHATGSVLLFTDVDAMIGDDSLAKLSNWFAKPGVGAVVGLRAIVDRSNFAEAQDFYVGFDAKIKNWEMGFLGSITSCDGKLYAIKANLMGQIPLHVTDDSFIGLGAPLKKERLVFDPSLVANIGKPVKSPIHEFERRRRITTRGLYSLRERKGLFRFSRYGWYSYCLFANKVCRRFAPLSFLFFLMVGSFSLGLSYGLTALVAIGLLVFVSFRYLQQSLDQSAILVKKSVDRVPPPSSLHDRLLGAISYLMLGMVAMTLGLIDFLTGKKIDKWEPKKSL